MSAAHPGIGHEMSLSQFVTARHVMVTSPRSGHAHVEDWLTQMGVHRNIVAKVPHFTVLPEFQVQVHWHRRQDTSVAHTWLIDETVRTLGCL